MKDEKVEMIELRIEVGRGYRKRVIRCTRILVNDGEVERLLCIREVSVVDKRNLYVFIYTLEFEEKTPTKKTGYNI